ncbi:helix-turn-helix DNA binding domain protein [Mycobacterium phage PascalRango]|nr:helix-turn-helix DNA binding domain protein [Mycobacterium phage PascalRango]
MDDLLTNKLIKKAAKSVGNSWILTSDQVEDLIQDLWVELLERPSRQQAISGVSEDEAVSYLRGHAGQILSVRMREEYLARGDWDYSAESIKDALKGRGDNPFLMEIIPQAIDRLADRHPPYAQALRVRYLDEVIVRDDAGKSRLKRAHQALAEEIHSVIVEMSDHDGPGSRSKVFPDSIRSHNGPGDPVGEMATRLADDGWKSAGEDGLTYRELFDLATAEQVTSSAPKHHRACPVCHHIVPISSGRFRDHLIPSCAGSGAAA